MPDNPISDDDLLAADIADLTPDDELAADIAAMNSQTPTDLKNAIDAGANNKPEEPERVPDVQFKEKAIGDEPWHARFADSFSPREDESRVPLASVAENLVPFNLGDEGSAVLMSLAEADPERAVADELRGNDPKARYQDVPRTQAQGDLEGVRATLEAEKIGRDEGALPGTVLAGQLGQGALAAAALPVTGPATAALAGPGLTAANYMGQGSGGLAERGKQALQTAEDHPVATLSGATLPALAAGAGRGAATKAVDLAERSALNRPRAVMSAKQLSDHMDNFGGREGLIRLGNEMDASGLSHNQGSNWWPGNWGPASAETVYKNAVKLRQNSGKALGEAEEEIVSHNPSIQVGNIAQDLRGGADDLEGSWRSTAPAEQAERRRMADLIDTSSDQAPGTPPTVPEGYIDPAVKPVARPPEGPWTPEVPGQEVKPEQWFQYLEDIKQVPPGAPVPPAPVAREAVPSLPPGPSVLTDRDWSDYLLAKEAHENPPTVPTGKMGFKDAVRQRRELDKDINFTKAGGVENAGVKEQVARQTGTALRQNIRADLGSAAEQNPALAKPVEKWNRANKDFSLASTVEDPAQLAMLKEYGGSLGLRDMSTAAMAHAVGLPGPLAAGAAAALKGGRGANALAGSQKGLSKTLGVFGTAAGPVTLASTQAALPDPEVQREKNQSMKDKLSEAASSGWNWFAELLE